METASWLILGLVTRTESKVTVDESVRPSGATDVRRASTPEPWKSVVYIGQEVLVLWTFTLPAK